MRRTWSRHAGRSVLRGATTPNRNGLAPPVASLSAIVSVLSLLLSEPGAGLLYHDEPARAESTITRRQFWAEHADTSVLARPYWCSPPVAGLTADLATQP